MTTSLRSRLRPARLAATIGITGVVVLSAAACADHATPAPTPQTTPARAPLTTSTSTSTASWAVVPMGRLTDPLNIFWELFVLPAGQSRWSLVTPRGMADNGGLVAATGAGQSAVIGVRASGKLHFSTVNQTANLGHSYTVGALPRALADRPDALAIGRDRKLLALVDPIDQLLSSPGRLSTWSPVLSAKTAAHAPATKSCGLASLDAVTVTAFGPAILGGSCNRPGTVALYTLTDAAVHPVRLRLPAAVAQATTAVLGLHTQDRTTSALLLARHGTHRTLLTASTTSPRQRWRTGPSLPLGPGQQILSLTSANADYGVLLSTPSRRGVFFQQTATGWHRLPAPPAGTATVATPTGQPPEAITIHGSTFSAWTYDGAARRWNHTQSISVPIQYGSSG